MMHRSDVLCCSDSNSSYLAICAISKLICGELIAFQYFIMKADEEDPMNDSDTDAQVSEAMETESPAPPDTVNQPDQT